MDVRLTLIHQANWSVRPIILRQLYILMKIPSSMTHLLLAFYLLISSCSFSQPEDIPARVESTVDPNKVLIVYLSRTNNTKAIAEIIHKNIRGRLVALELVNPYPKDYRTIVEQVANENARGYLPPLKTRIEDIEKYNIVFVGFPTWGMQLPPPMKSFLTQYDLSGKTIVPFNTNAGYGTGSSFQTVKDLCPNSTIVEGFSTKGGVERDGIYFVMEGEKEKQAQAQVKKWLQKIKMLQPGN
jgi:flavodoxin